VAAKLKLLLVLPRPLFPADAGGKIRTLNIFARLAERLEMHAISLADLRTERAGVAEMKKLFPAYTPVEWKETLTFSPAFYARFIASRFSRFPYFLEKYRVPALRAEVGRLVERERFDVVLCDFLQTAAAVMDLPLGKRVVFEHNVEYVIRKRHWERETHPVKKWLLEAEWRKAFAVEGEVCRTFDHVITVSEGDRKTVEQDFRITHVSDLPTGVDLDFFQPRAEPERPGNLVFVGSMDWHPNEDGIFWFVQEVFPRIRQQAPQASLTVVGRNPSARLKQLAGHSGAIEITGTVPDVRPHVARAQVVVVPLRIGGGTRIKIFEAMSMGKAVVSTTLGAEGLPLAGGSEILLADRAEEFARGVVRLLNDPAQRAAVGRAARLKVQREHGWDGVAARMEQILSAVAAERKG
jgi:glycosyltransferase involved in cell wall biosynthesis